MLAERTVATEIKWDYSLYKGRVKCFGIFGTLSFWRSLWFRRYIVGGVGDKCGEYSCFWCKSACGYLIFYVVIGR